MPISSGKTFGHYEVLSPLGAGGMGEVYLARDTLLDRSIALKFLSPEIANDQQRLRRFVQEAKAASSQQRYISPYYFALIYVGLGQDQEAIAWLQKARDERQPYLILMNVEPVFDRLHSNPEFIAIERSVGLEP